MHPENLYKIVSLDDWAKSQKAAEIVRSSIDKAFVHLAREDQVAHVVDKFWSKSNVFILLKLSSDNLVGELRYETNPGGQTKYYHLYDGKIPLVAVVQATKIENKMKCACHSGKTYGVCCGIYHHGILPKNALALMRSRYCAYAKKLAGYLMATTHPQNPHYLTDKNEWEKQILLFCNHTVFQNLKILSFQDGETEAFVSFTAVLRQQGRDASFTEKSRFQKVEGRWLYVDGQIS
jgi:SEC-C motif-containing protein